MHAKAMFVLSRFAIMVATLPVTALAADTGTSPGLDADLAITDAPRELGQHPAVLVYRDWSTRGYDYASKFYLHPARLALLPEAPREMSEHPAVLVARQMRNRGYGEATKIGLHPAVLPKATRVAPPETNLALDLSVGGTPSATASHEPGSTSER